MTDPSDANDTPDSASRPDGAPAQGPAPRVGRAAPERRGSHLVDEEGPRGDDWRDQDRPEPGLNRMDPTAPPSRMTLRGAPAIVVLIVVTSLIELALSANELWRIQAIQSFAMWPLQVYAVMESALPLSELKSVVTHAFLHGGLMHLAFNMMAFAAIGPPIERGLGTLVFVPVYLLLAVAGGLAHVGWEWIVFLYIDGTDTTNLITPLVGASGAIFGVLGLDLGRKARALEAIPPGYRATTPLLYLTRASIGVVVINVVLMVSGLPISGAAHLGGFLLGILLSRVLFRPGGGRAL